MEHGATAALFVFKNMRCLTSALNRTRLVNSMASLNPDATG